MATLPTPEEKARMVLKIFGHFGTQPGEVLRPNNFVAICAEWGLRISDLAKGLEYGATKGWFEYGPNGSIRLTEAGFSEI